MTLPSASTTGKARADGPASIDPAPGKGERMRATFARLAALAGLDPAVTNVITARLWSLLAGPIGIFLIAHRLSPAEQGFYYAFSGVLGIRVFLELGLSYVVLQFASHEMAGLQWKNERLTGEAAHYARLADLFRKSLRWYSVAAVLVIAIVLPAGLWFLGQRGEDAAHVSWMAPWAALVTAAAFMMSLVPVTAIIEGCGRVHEVTRVRLWEGVAMGISLWIGLLSGCGLFAAAISNAAAVMVTVTWLAATKRGFIAELLRSKGESTLSWQREIAPLQWRTAVVWIGGYFSNQFFVPTTFATHGPEMAGRLGMTLYLITVVAIVSLQWMQTKAAPFGQMVAQGDRARLDAVYTRTVWQVVIFYILGCIALAAGIQFLLWWHLPIANRLLELPTTLVFMAALGLNQVTACRSIYVRAHKSEPFYILQLANGVAVGLLLVFLLPRTSLFFTGLAYLFGACLPVLYISGLMFQRYRRQHASSFAPVSQ